MAPDDLQVSPTTAADGLVVTWRKVTRNVENHQLPDTSQTNYVYRAETLEDLEDVASLPSCLVVRSWADPQDSTTPLVSWTDLDPDLVPPYGTKPFFYRIRVADPFGNLGAPSAVITGTVPDTTPPGPTDLVGATGVADHILVEWKPNAEPDVAGYQIYRGVCDLGFIYRPGITHEKNKEGKVITRGESRYPCDMTLVGDSRWRRELDVRGRRPHLVRRLQRPGGLAALLRLLGPRLRLRQQPLPGHNGCPASRRSTAARGCARRRLRPFAVDDWPAGTQQRRARRVDLLAGSGPARLPRVPFGRRARPAACSSRASSPTARSAPRRGRGWFPRAPTCRPCPIRSPRAARTSTPPPSRTMSTGTACRRSIGWATRATARASRTSRRAARSRTRATSRSRLRCCRRLRLRCRRLRPRRQLDPAVRSRHAPGLRRVPGRVRRRHTGRCPGILTANGFTDPAARRGIDYLYASSRSTIPASVPTLAAGPAPVLTHRKADRHGHPRRVRPHT